MKKILAFTAISLAVFLSGSVQALAQNAPPAAPVREVTDTYFGTKVVDPYRWMENTKDPEFISWMKAQNDFTQAILDRISGRKELLARIKELDNAGTSVSAVQPVSNLYFYYKVAPGDDNRKLYVRDGLQGMERLLFDPEKITAGGKHYSIDYFTPSLDAKYVAYGISPGGSEDSVMYVIETATGKQLSDQIDRAQFGGPTWLPDGRSFYYNRLQKLGTDAKPTDRYLKSRIYRHVLGTNPDEDQAVLGVGVSPLITIADTDGPFITYSPASKYVFGILTQFVRNEFALYAAPLDSINGAKTPWQKITDFSDDVTSFDVHGDDLYLLTHHGASRYKVIRTSVSKPDLAHADVIVQPSDAVVTNVGVAKDALYVQLLDGGIGRLLRVPFERGSTPQPIALPFDGTISALVTDPRLSGVLLQLTAWTKSPLWFAYAAAGVAAAVTIGPYLVLVLLASGGAELARRTRAIALLTPLASAAPAGLAWTAFKVGALSFGGGFVIVPLMQGDAVHTYHWMSQSQFLNAVAIGQVTPGPVVATVAAVGYAAGGIAGGALAAAVAFAPSFTFVLLGGRRFERLRANAHARAFLDGAGPAAIGAILGAAITLAAALSEPWQAAILTAAAVALLVLRRGIVETLVVAGAVGAIAAIAGAPVP